MVWEIAYRLLLLVLVVTALVAASMLLWRRMDRSRETQQLADAVRRRRLAEPGRGGTLVSVSACTVCGGGLNGYMTHVGGIVWQHVTPPADMHVAAALADDIATEKGKVL